MNENEARKTERKVVDWAIREYSDSHPAVKRDDYELLIRGSVGNYFSNENDARDFICSLMPRMSENLLDYVRHCSDGVLTWDFSFGLRTEEDWRYFETDHLPKEPLRGAFSGGIREMAKTQALS